MDRNSMYVGINIRYLRKKRGYTQEELASKLGVSQASIANYESGKILPETKNLIELASILKTSVDQLCRPIKGVEDNG